MNNGNGQEPRLPTSQQAPPQDPIPGRHLMVSSSGRRVGGLKDILLPLQLSFSNYEPAPIVRALIDTGAALSVMSEELLRTHWPDMMYLDVTPPKMEAMGGTEVTILGVVQATFTISK